MRLTAGAALLTGKIVAVEHESPAAEKKEASEAATRKSAKPKKP